MAWLATFFFVRLKAAEASTPTRENAENATFKPIVEASLPDGFPGYTPVGEIEVKHYPAYRKAGTSGRVAFWTLFGHIKSERIGMTAPVEMTFQKDGPPMGREQSMGFLYGNKNAGNAGRKGNVDVIDVPAIRVAPHPTGHADGDHPSRTTRPARCRGENPRGWPGPRRRDGLGPTIRRGWLRGRPERGRRGGKSAGGQLYPHPCGRFCTRNGPMTSASRSVLRKVRTASCGEQTRGSSQSLNDVLSKMGTPVQRPNACNNS